MPPVRSKAYEYATFFIYTFVGEEKNVYKKFKSRYEILRVKVNGEDKKIDEQSEGFPLNCGGFKIRPSGNEVEIYVRNQQTKDIIRIHVPIYIHTSS